MKKISISLVLAFVLLFSSAAFASPDYDYIEFEYDGRIIRLRLDDLILTDDGGMQIEPFFFEEELTPQQQQQRRITQDEFLEEQRARRWIDAVHNLELRQIDERAMDLVRDFYAARDVPPPILGQQGSIVLNFGSHIPRIIARPLYITEVILEVGERVTGIFPGDTVRWQFTPGEIGEGDTRQISVFIRPLMPDISTNLIITTNRRRYHLYIMSSIQNHMPSISFAYPQDSMRAWDSFIARHRQERERGLNVIAEPAGHTPKPEEIHLRWNIEGGERLRWRPVAVFDDGVFTYVRFADRSAVRSMEAPVFIIFERRREVITNYRWVGDMMVINRVFDVGALIVGTGAHQDRVVLRRLP